MGRTNEMNQFRRWAVITVGLCALTACTSTGSGGGQIAATDGNPIPVSFSWKSTDGGMSGTMNASLPNATYQGNFFQITRETRFEMLMPLWRDWRPGWHDWPYWGYRSMPYPSTHFYTYYSGKVLATLESENKTKMRCRFHLVDPSRGMRGGGEGECQLSDGKLIQANFTAS